MLLGGSLMIIQSAAFNQVPGTLNTPRGANDINNPYNPHLDLLDLVNLRSARAEQGVVACVMMLNLEYQP